MIVAFMSVGESPRYALSMLKSVRQTMPNIDVLHLTDEDTPQIPGTSTVRLPNTYDNLTIFRMYHLSQLSEDALCLDTDVVVCRSVKLIFDLEFDVGLTYRTEKVVDPNGVDITKLMPYNTGVLFCRNPAFWKASFELGRDKGAGWYTDQLAVAAVARSNHFNILKLHCDNFNYKPKSADDDLSCRYIVHYKGGARKHLDQLIGEEQ